MYIMNPNKFLYVLTVSMVTHPFILRVPIRVITGKQ